MISKGMNEGESRLPREARGLRVGERPPAERVSERITGAGSAISGRTSTGGVDYGRRETSDRPSANRMGGARIMGRMVWWDVS